jgi:hypothetical protein
MSWIGYVAISVAVSLVTFYGLGGLVHWRFYLRRRAKAADWKLQPDRWLGPAQTRQAIWLGGANIVMGAIIGGTLAFLPFHGLRWLGVPAGVIVAVHAGACVLLALRGIWRLPERQRSSARSSLP